MKLKFSKPTKFEWIVLCVVLGAVAFMAFVLHSYIWQIRFGAVKYGMYREIDADILDAIKSKYKIVKCTVELPPDDTIELSLELDPEAEEQAFDIAGDVYDLKRKSPVLHKKPLELEIRVRDPKNGVTHRTYMPGVPNHKKKKNYEEYRELAEKWSEIIRQKEMAERRAAEGNEGQ